MEENKARFKYPYSVTERFVSIKGEGLYVGVPMCFYRLSGCAWGGVHGTCVNWDGKSFICDTGPSYKNGIRTVEWNGYDTARYMATSEQIWQDVKSQRLDRVVITGGEPLEYDLEPLAKTCPVGHTIHIETSGNIDQSRIIDCHREKFWVTVNVKGKYKPSMLHVADEIKVLISETVDEEELMALVESLPYRPLFLMPIEDQNWTASTARCQALVIKHPKAFRLGFQLHKLMNTR